MDRDRSISIGMRPFEVESARSVDGAFAKTPEVVSVRRILFGLSIAVACGMAIGCYISFKFMKRSRIQTFDSSTSSFFDACDEGLKRRYCAADPKKNKLTVVLSRHGQKTNVWKTNLAKWLGEEEQKLLSRKRSHPILIEDQVEQDKAWYLMYHARPKMLTPSAIYCEQMIGEAFAKYYRPSTAERSETWFYAYSDIDGRVMQSCKAFTRGYTDDNTASVCNNKSEEMLSEGVRISKCNGALRHKDHEPASPEEMDLDDYKDPADRNRISRFRELWDHELYAIADDIQRTTNLAASEDADKKDSNFLTLPHVRFTNHDEFDQRKEEQERTKQYMTVAIDTAAKTACLFAEQAVNEFLASSTIPEFYPRFNKALGIDEYRLTAWLRVCYWQWSFYATPRNSKIIMAEFIVHLHASLSLASGKKLSFTPETIKHNDNGKKERGFLMHMSHDTNVQMLALLLETRPWPLQDLASQLPRDSVPYHAKLIVELTADNMVQLKVFAPKLWEAARRFVGIDIVEGQNILLLHFSCGAERRVTSCHVNTFLNKLAMIYRDAKVKLFSSQSEGRCVSESSSKYGDEMIRQIASS